MRVVHEAKPEGADFWHVTYRLKYCYFVQPPSAWFVSYCLQEVHLEIQTVLSLQLIRWLAETKENSQIEKTCCSQEEIKPC